VLDRKDDLVGNRAISFPSLRQAMAQRMMALQADPAIVGEKEVQP
jgi:hypothetical protein